MAIVLDRDYNSTGIISAGSGLYVYNDTLNKYELLIPTRDYPAGPGAPDTIDNALLTVSKNGQVEGKQTVTQKEYTINFNRDAIRRLNQFKGKQCKFLQRFGMDYTGSLFTGTLTFSEDAGADNALMDGKIYITVNEDLGYVDDIRDIYCLTAIITTPLPDVNLVGTGSIEMNIEGSPKATFTVKSETPTVATATLTSGKLTVTGVAEGTCIIELTASATGEATSHRTMLVKVESAE